MMTIRLPNGNAYTYKNADDYDIFEKNTYFLYQKNPDRKVIAIVNIESGVIIETVCPDCVSKSKNTFTVDTINAKSFGRYLQDNKDNLSEILRKMQKDNVLHWYI